MATLLIADDEESIRTILHRALSQKGHTVVLAQNGAEALNILKTEAIDGAILDIRMPEMTGLELLNHQSEFKSHPFIFIATAQDTMENAVEAMKRGATDYLVKPFNLEELHLLLDREIKNRQLRSEMKFLKEEVGAHATDRLTLVGKSPSLREVYKKIGKLANQNVNVLITGESGTGKEMVAKALHYQGNRAPYSFVAVNCSAIPKELLESELFGHKKGAFTGAVHDKIGLFESAHLGTLFLDEIGDLPLSLQAKLLRVIQEHEVLRVGETSPVKVDVRLLAATNRDLKTEVKKGTFREDLYYRLHVVPIEMAPLRERKEDISLLANHFLNRLKHEGLTVQKMITPEGLLFLQSYNWPGNVRELENVVKRAAIMGHSTILDQSDFSPFLSSQKNVVSQGSSIEELIENFVNLNSTQHGELYERAEYFWEKPFLETVLKRTNFNQVQAAEILGINRNTLHKKLKKYSLL